MVRDDSRVNKVEPYDIRYLPEAIEAYVDGDWVAIEDANPSEALIKPNDIIELPPGTINLKDIPTTSTYGFLLFNFMVIEFSFGDKIPYVSTNDYKSILNKLTDNLVDEDKEVAGKFIPSELRRFTQSMLELTGLVPYIAATGSAATLTTHPEMVKTREALFERYKDQLDDPAIITMIQNELVELDKAWIESNGDSEFYKSNKSFTVKRKKMFVMHGIEASFAEGNEFELIKTSLAEGWNPKDLVSINNSIREGSYDRGAGTAKGGEFVNTLQRIFQNVKVIEGDCGTKLTTNYKVSEFDYKSYIGMNYVSGTKLIEFTEELAKSNMGKVLKFRRPILCQSELTDFCESCVGPKLSASPYAIGQLISDMGSILMSTFMASMHGTELSVSEYDFNIAIR